MDHSDEAYAPRPACEFPNSLLEPRHRFRRQAPLRLLVIREAESQEFPFPWSSHCTLLAVHSKLELRREESRHHRLLDEPIQHRRDDQRELHLSTASIWDGPRSATHSIRCAVNVSPYSRSDASLAMTLSFFVDWIAAPSSSHESGRIGLILPQLIR